ncbi:class I adenylate-forming enzyme family protein [Atlantibacter sp.]|uniref:class I adenylate-forming enzyme family protein n=1 Tax=Atlantibacter sp. TaxID=1903473 RepID=UPI0028A7B72A|nr:class I adenylate-forming enzyme family protein [Atlantibacter sp.]
MSQTLRNLGDLTDRALPQSRLAIIDLRDPEHPRDYTHQQIDELAGGVAQYLQQRGYARGSAIGIAALNRAEYLAAYFGIMRAGLVAVPLNIKVPQETLHYFIEDAAIALVFADGARAELLKDRVAVVDFDSDFSEIVTPQVFNAVIPEKDELAMMLYTSGSTGRPKGVPLTHYGQYWALDVTRGGVEPDDAQSRYIVAQPLFHMNGLFLAKRVFATNGLLVVLPSFSIESYLHALSHYRINIVTAVPTMFARLLRDPEIDRYNFSALRKVMLGSAPITLGLLNRINAAFPGVEITHGYGTTEAGPAVFGPHPGGLPTPPLSLGYPLAAGELKFADGHNGNEGVLMMRNPAVTPGYHRLPEKSAQVLQDGWYYSGDVMRRDENGFYFFIGRADDMFVCSGENIYPGEVEKLLESHPAVRQASVVPLPDEERSQVPVAFVVLQEGENVTREALKQHTLAHGPAYQHPRRIAFLPELPWAATNKVDRQSLRQLASTLEQEQRWEA